MVQDDVNDLDAQGPKILQPSPGASLEDLAGGLFTNKNHALASVVRDLQLRSKQAKQQRNGSTVPVLADSDKVQDGLEERASATNGNDVEMGPGMSLWVVGGASTVMDVNGVNVTQTANTGIKTGGQITEETDVSEPVVKPLEKDGYSKAENVPAPPQPSRASTSATLSQLKRCVSGVGDVFQDLVVMIRLYPSTLIVPLVLFLILAGLGVWGVMAGAAAHVNQKKDDVRSRAVDAATGFQIQLQQSFTPGVTFQLLVKQQPNWEFWLKNFNSTAAELLTRVPANSLWNLQLQPFGQVMLMHPFRPEDESQVNPPRDLLGDPTRRDGFFTSIKSHDPVVNGPFNLVQGFLGAFVRYPIYVPDVDANESFGFRYRDNTSAIPYSSLPASVRSCTVCYNATSREKWWGMMTVLVNYDEVTHGQDAYLANLRKMGMDYELVRYMNATYDLPIYKTDRTRSMAGTDAVTIEVKAIDGVWILRVSPKDGFEPSWRGPLISGVIMIAFIMALLLFVSLASFKRQVLLLQETVAANHKLAETTAQLREEKERMDVLLVRQYDLLRCLDTNRATKRSGDESLDTTGNSRKAMMTRIEDARRSLNVAKSSVEDPIQVFEVLGEGAFGKVQRGLWRGTVVAVKTMILPANMTGQEKREKMAVMEAAISSSLVHPNIVTTYTYFIRPYHEPTNEGVMQMTSLSYVDKASFKSNGSDSAQPNSIDHSGTSEGIIHSYEVRLVLEFCDKGSLKDALDQNVFMQGSLNIAAMLETAADVGKAMVHMHAANVLHADLKARNIMMKSSGTEGRGVIAKVADFGLSTRMEHQETHLSSCFQGTLTHMAPEVMLEGRMSKAADVYSFGILMWELFCAGDPFAGVPRAHMGHAITKECRRPKFPLFAPRGYVALATRCWDPDASLRPCFEDVLAELVRMREELGGETRPLQITPPAPITPNQSNDGALLRAPHSNAQAQGSMMVSANVNAAGLGIPGVISRDNPLAMYKGIVIGGASSMSNGTGGVDTMSAGAGAGSKLGATGSGTGSTFGSVFLNMSLPTTSPLHQRAIIKSSLAQRHLRKLGIRVAGGNSGLGSTLSALDEEHEQRDGSM